MVLINPFGDHEGSHQPVYRVTRKGSNFSVLFRWGREASHNGKVNFSGRMRMYKVSWNYIDFFFLVKIHFTPFNFSVVVIMIL